jgi:hypothetical protein
MCTASDFALQQNLALLCEVFIEIDNAISSFISTLEFAICARRLCPAVQCAELQKMFATTNSLQLGSQCFPIDCNQLIHGMRLREKPYEFVFVNEKNFNDVCSKFENCVSSKRTHVASSLRERIHVLECKQRKLQTKLATLTFEIGIADNRRFAALKLRDQTHRDLRRKAKRAKKEPPLLRAI